MRFLKDNWIWILAPVLLVIVLAVVISLMNTSADPQGFEYPL